MWLVSFSRPRSRRLAAGLATLFAFTVSATQSSSAESSSAPAIRWRNTDARPLRVWVHPDSREDSSAGRLRESVRAAFEAWSTAASMEFRFSPDSAAADVRVYASKSALFSADGVRVNALTHCEVDDSSHIVRADIVVATRRANGRSLSRNALLALMKHEVGHALGLVHSPNSSSIMFSTVQVNRLSPGDVASVRALYGASPVRTAVIHR